MRRALTVIALVAGMLATPAGASATAVQEPDRPGHDGVGVRLVDVPVARAEDPRARAYVIDHVAPGDVIERRLEVSNGTRSPADISLYPAAADIGGGGFIGAEGRTANALSSWTSVTPREPTLAARGATFVDVTIKVPDDAASGEHYGVVWAEMTTPPPDGLGVTQVSRAGVRLYVSVGPGGEPVSDFKITSLTPGRADDGTPFVQANVHNTGGRALDLRGTLRLSDGPGGLSAGPFDVTLGTTLGLDQTEPVTVPLDKALPAGPWRARISIESGLLERTAKATITFPDTGLGDAVPTEQDGGFPWWWAAAGMALLLLLIFLIAFLYRRKSSDDRQLVPTVPVDGHRA